MSTRTAVFVGVATEDSIAVVDTFPEPDQRVIASDMAFGGGGPAATAAVACARLGVPSAVIAAVGDDEEGARVRDRLEQDGVDAAGLIVVPGAETSRSIVVISGAERSRAIVNRVGPTLDLSSDAGALESLTSATWVHVDQHGWGAVNRLRKLIGSGVRLSIDAGNEIAGLDLRDTALYVPTREALERRYAGADLDEAMRLARRDGAESVVVTDGGRGSYGVDAVGTRVSVTPPTASVLSTLGAGDVFHGALIAGLTHLETGRLEGGFAAAVAYATAAATLSCRGLDGRSRIPNHEETVRAFASTGTPQNRIPND